MATTDHRPPQASSSAAEVAGLIGASPRASFSLSPCPLSPCTRLAGLPFTLLCWSPSLYDPTSPFLVLCALISVGHILQ